MLINFVFHSQFVHTTKIKKRETKMLQFRLWWSSLISTWYYFRFTSLFHRTFCTMCTYTFTFTFFVLVDACYFLRFSTFLLSQSQYIVRYDEAQWWLKTVVSAASSLELSLKCRLFSVAHQKVKCTYNIHGTQIFTTKQYIFAPVNLFRETDKKQ